jgi:hypothetical protein
MKINNKDSLYAEIKRVMSKTGQGIPKWTIVKYENTSGIKLEWFEELLKEGLLKSHIDRYLAFGFDDEWYYPSQGYAYYEEEEEKQLWYLTFVRVYLGLPTGDGNMEIPHPDFLNENGKYYNEYFEWLNKNKEQLEIMKNLK